LYSAEMMVLWQRGISETGQRKFGCWNTALAFESQISLIYCDQDIL